MKLRYYIPVIVWMGIIFLLSSIPNLELSGNLSSYDYFLRKSAHVIEYIILSILWFIALTKNNSIQKALVYAAMLSIFYSISDEIHQSFVPTRSARPTDVLFDTGGVLITLCLIKLCHEHKSQQQSARN